MCSHNRGYDIICFENGDLFVGRTSDDGKPNGYGILIDVKTVAKYKGKWKYDPETYTKYRGGWKDGKYHGHGWLIPCDGDYYHGEFANGKYHGKGEIDFADESRIDRIGDSYEGEFANGEMHGKGVYCSGDTQEECEYKNGERVK